MTTTAKTGSTAASNTGYLSIKKLHDNWDDSDSVANYNEVVSVLSTSPAGSGKTYANYTVTHNLSYTGDKDDTSVTDTYQNGIISQDSDGDYVLEKLGTPNAKGLPVIRWPGNRRCSCNYRRIARSC
ncbi:hypothetical protein ACXOZG_02700 [Lactobacillus delbrueckii subsp. bulgaricus]|uniref:hypothetical protein n=1 Tax=Lactobacillus delbrueckii TaxID=1584 RepID=UPI0020733CE0|nr:hypothetical protein [Lactobacillus delbrueckii]